MKFLLLFLITVSILGLDKNNDLKKDQSYQMNVVQKNQNDFEDNKVIEVIDQKTIKKINKGSIKSVLSESGINLQQTGAGQLSPFLRGLTGQHTLIVFDGIKLNSSIFRYGPNQYSAILDPNIIGKIEVLRGAAPTLYGSDAVGGVISFSSEKLDKKRYFSSQFDTLTNSMGLHVDIADQIKELKFNIQASLNDHQKIEAGGDIGLQDFTSYQNKSVTAKFAYNLNDNLGELIFLATYFSQKDGFRTDKSKKDDYRVYPNQNHGLYYIKYKNYLSKMKTSLDSTLYFQKTYEEYKRFKSERNREVLSDHRIDDLYQYGVNLRTTTKFNKLTLYNGTEFIFDYLNSDKNYYDNSKYSTFSLFTKGEYSVSDFLFGAGARYTFVHLAEVENASYLKNNVSFSGFAQYNLKNYNISLNFAQGFRAPNLNDLTGSSEFNGGYEFGNSDLSAENSYMFELVNKFKYKNLSLSLSAYYSILDGFISRKQIEKPAGYEDYDQVVQKENVNDGYITGFEFLMIYNFRDFLELKFNTSYSYGMMDEIVDSENLITNLNPMRRIPPLQGLVKLTYKQSDYLSIFYRGQFAALQDRLSNGDIKDSRIPEGGTPEYFVSSLGLYTSIDKFFLSVIFENITNEKYKYHGSGLYESGRSVYLKLEADF